MQLTNHWWQLIWLFGAGFIIMYMGPARQERVLGKIEYRWGWGPAIALALPYIIWAGTRRYIGDTETYIQNFKNLPEGLGQIIPYLAENTKDQGFSVFSIIFKTLISNSHTVFFMFIAIVQMGCLIYLYRKYSTNYFLSMFLFIVSTDYISWMHNGMRQFIAATIIAASFDLIVKKKYVPLIIVILLASTIHGSALMMIPIVFIVQGKPWNEKTILFIVGIIVLIMFIDRFTPILNDLLLDTQYNDLVTNELWTADDGTNIIRVAVYSVPALLSLVGLRYVNQANDPVINICVNCSIMTMALYLLASVSSGIYIGRLPIYTTLQGYIALPWLIDNMFTKRSAQFVKMMMIGLYLFFFYYQMHFTWNFI